MKETVPRGNMEMNREATQRFPGEKKDTVTPFPLIMREAESVSKTAGPNYSRHKGRLPKGDCSAAPQRKKFLSQTNVNSALGLN